MGINKKCNAIKHSVYVGDGISLWYEKPEIMTHSGTFKEQEQLYIAKKYIEVCIKTALEQTQLSAHAMSLTTKNFISNKVELVEELLRDKQADMWPKHNILCGEINTNCYKCKMKPRKYTKAMEE